MASATATGLLRALGHRPRLRSYLRPHRTAGGTAPRPILAPASLNYPLLRWLSNHCHPALATRMNPAGGLQVIRFCARCQTALTAVFNIGLLPETCCFLGSLPKGRKHERLGFPRRMPGTRRATARAGRPSAPTSASSPRAALRSCRPWTQSRGSSSGLSQHGNHVTYTLRVDQEFSSSRKKY